MLDIRNLKVLYGPIEAVHGISLRVEEGQCVTLLGPNGAGKSSTISAICGVAKATGDITFLGQDLLGTEIEDRVRAGISVSPEGRRIFSNLSVEANLQLGAGIRTDRDGIEADIDHWFTTFPILGERRTQSAGTLSGGEQQMLAIARALMAKPKILLLDEPSLGLAPRIVGQIFDMIEQLKSEGMTILLVEQNARQALRISDYAYLLNTGTIQAEGTTATLGQNDELMAKLTGLG
ncbi:ATP-binding cassette domain-containing protein [Alphaproteobacteria bacterium GH1-50]|uniref:ATP-binding cassette domain-containing protein n=1 Tax=Kangsaoukella pontilimi TaxID=2691042 RepID=A0A7C9INI4_9RHOB|nr:ABC transporter ATP-binding protein [Kangsaoukella pontilimi]MXQ07390.1 ATP-binding cassette domain-containing protein [Kangsaoukella pontilimi]